MKTFSLRKEDIQRNWYEIDLKGKTIGRAATEIARLLIGKHKSIYTPHMDCGDFVIVTNCDKLAIAANKKNNKHYFTYSGYQSGDKLTSLAEMLSKHPNRVIERAVSGMLPKNKHRQRRMKRLKVYVANAHPHTAQQPEKIEL